MYRINRKKLAIAGIFLILIIIILTSIFLLFSGYFNSESKMLSQEIKQISSENSDYLPEDLIEAELKTFNNPSSPDIKKYNALKSIFYLFDNAYANTNNPEIRLFISEMDKYASENLKRVYVKGEFYTACVDETCGEATPSEIESIIEEIRKLPIEEEWKNSITFNLRNASHIPYDTNFNKQDKLITYSLAIGQLVSLDNKEASVSAENLRKYLKNKYNQDL